MPLLKTGDTVALVGCSNGLSTGMQETIAALKEVLEGWGLEVLSSPYIYAQKDVFAASGKDRAVALMNFYQNESVKAIFDISGGDIANQVLPFLDFERIKKANKPYFGYSDLTTVIDSIYAKTGISSYLYQVRFLIGDDAKVQQEAFYKSLFEEQEDLFQFDYHFIKGEKLEGIIIGGNIRCLLKLAGTPYFPDFKDKVLFLEGMSGKPAQMATFLNQYKQMGVLDEVKGILLGSFLEMEEKALSPTIEELLLELIGDRDIPIAKTMQIGHGKDSKCLRIGERISL